MSKKYKYFMFILCSTKTFNLHTVSMDLSHYMELAPTPLEASRVTLGGGKKLWEGGAIGSVFSEILRYRQKDILFLDYNNII